MPTSESISAFSSSGTVINKAPKQGISALGIPLDQTSQPTLSARSASSTPSPIPKSTQRTRSAQPGGSGGRVQAPQVFHFGSNVSSHSNNISSTPSTPSKQNTFRLVSLSDITSPFKFPQPDEDKAYKLKTVSQLSPIGAEWAEQSLQFDPVWSSEQSKRDYEAATGTTLQPLSHLPDDLFPPHLLRAGFRRAFPSLRDFLDLGSGKVECRLSDSSVHQCVPDAKFLVPAMIWYREDVECNRGGNHTTFLSNLTLSGHRITIGKCMFCHARNLACEIEGTEISAHTGKVIPAVSGSVPKSLEDEIAGLEEKVNLNPLLPKEDILERCKEIAQSSLRREKRHAAERGLWTSERGMLEDEILHLRDKVDKLSKYRLERDIEVTKKMRKQETLDKISDLIKSLAWEESQDVDSDVFGNKVPDGGELKNGESKTVLQTPTNGAVKLTLPSLALQETKISSKAITPSPVSEKGEVECVDCHGYLISDSSHQCCFAARDL